MEPIFYVLIWVSGVFYALWSFCDSALDIRYMLNPFDFAEGWTILKHEKDISDVEWAVFTAAFKIYWRMSLVQVLYTQCVLRENRKALPFFYTVYSVILLSFYFGAWMVALYIFYILLMCVVHSTGWKTPCYGFAISSLYLFHHDAFREFRESVFPKPIEGFLIEFGLVWLVARSLSFALDRIESNSHRNFTERDLLQIFSYCLYLPVIFSGPLLDYETFVHQVTKEKKWKMHSFLKTALLFYKPICGYFLLELLHHFVISAIQYHPDLLNGFDAWSICGLGYALTILFYMKYFTIYSLCGTIAALEHFEFPPPPKCVSRIHVPSLLWGNFDRGLYLWILKYIYLPIMKTHRNFGRKLCALAVCFLFISLWHGINDAICIWAALSFFGVAVEMSTSFIFATRFDQVHEEFLFLHERSLNALVSTPLFMMMCISNVFFLSNVQVGTLVFKRILLGGMVPLIPTAVIMYFGCHVSLLIKKKEENTLRYQN